MNIDKKPLFTINSKLLVCLILVIVNLAVYWNLGRYDFINYDDNAYVYENRQIQSGLTKENLSWSFSFQKKAKAYWHPLTWISHMLDVELYGMDAGRHHLINVLFHIASTLLLFLALNRMTGALWRSAFVAALFALHPINVESVAWVAERKNVLSTFFWMLTLLAYAIYHERPGMVRYFAVLFVFALGLLAKPMLVTLPFVLLLLDYWPLGQNGRQGSSGVSERTAYHLILEKIPLFLLSGLSVYLSSSSLRGVGSYLSLQSIPMTLRIGNASVSYVKYMGKMIWPAQLAIFYPYPDTVPILQVTGALIFLIAASIFVLFMLKQHGYLAVGWFWFIGTLIPVSGLVQAGLWPAMADRWAYVPMIGLFIIITWGAEEIFNRWRLKRIPLAFVVLSILMTLMAVARIQVGHWASSITIFERAITATGGSWIAHNNLANSLKGQGRINEAIRHYHLALEKDPPDPEGIYYNMAIALTAQGRIPLAIERYSDALKINPDYADAHINMGALLARQGKTNEAINHYLEALRIESNSDKAHFNLGNALLAQGRIDEAINNFSRALHLNPSFAETYNSMGLALMQKAKLEEAILWFRKAANIKPDYRDAQENQKLAESINAKIRNAVAEMRDSMHFDHQDPEIDLKMLKLLEKKKELDQALNQFSKALSLQPGFTSLDRDRISIVFDIKKKYEAKLAQFHQIIQRRPDNAAAAYHIACIYSRRGQSDDAIKWLNQSIQKGFNRWDLIKTDSDLNGIRSSQDFQVLVKG
jgi:tetratricopeptide (TPR) repeat protein